jgi:hypothetical protein
MSELGAHSVNAERTPGARTERVAGYGGHSRDASIAGVLRWYDSKINNGILEGLNSLVQAAKAKARGYRTFKNLKAMIYMLTGKLDYTKTGLPI